MQYPSRNWLIVLLPFLALLAMPAQASKHDPMYVPEPIEVPSGKGFDEVRKAVRKALFDEGFSAHDIASGDIEAKRTKSGKNGAYSAVVKVRFDSRTIRISYKSSDGLYYDATDNTIHSTYNKWVRNIEKRVRRGLGAY